MEKLWLKLNTENIFLIPHILLQIFFGKTKNHVLNYLRTYNALITWNIKINFMFYVYSSTYFWVGLKNVGLKERISD